jgi:hypothetical protein
MECPTCGDDYKELKVHLNKSKPSHLPENWPTCHNCGKWYKRFGTHWSISCCDYPNITDYQHNIIAGILMGDGWIGRDKDNARFEVSLIREEYLEWLKTQLSPISLDVHMKDSARESALRNGGEEENYNSIYRLQTIYHPELNKYKDWYKTGKKIFPKDINMTPTTLKSWYVCDGHYKNTSGDNYITISMSNESGNHKKIENYFKSKDLPKPTWQEGVSVLRGREFPRFIARWSVEDSKQLFDYMGSPPPGFEYKWPKNLR